MISYIIFDIIYDINMIPLPPSPPSSARPSSLREPAGAAAGGGRGVVLSPLPQLAPHPAVTAAGSVRSAA